MTRAALLALALLPAGCARLVCGDGTLEDGRICVPADSVDCGDGTVREGDACVPLDSLECGPGTIRIDDECAPEESITCGEGTVRRGDECVAVLEEWVHLPAEAGTVLTVSQGNHGTFSHDGSAVYAVDFPMPEGSEVAAVRAGRVQRVREDSDTGCGDPECSSQANYVVVDHGDGTAASYYHLQFQGSLVQVGDVVDRGEVIALSGNTGWSTGPHLHLQINDLLRQSVPVRFEDLRDVSDGMAFGRDIPFTSTNTREAAESPPEWSTCPEDLFLWLGVRLDPGIPCVAAIRGRSYDVGGVQFGTEREAVFATHDGSWDYRCTSTDAEGRWSGVVTFEADRGYEFFIAGAGEGDCTFTNGWPYSPRVVIVDE